VKPKRAFWIKEQPPAPYRKADFFAVYCAMECGVIFLRFTGLIPVRWALVLAPVWIPLLVLTCLSIVQEMLGAIGRFSSVRKPQTRRSEQGKTELRSGQEASASGPN